MSSFLDIHPFDLHPEKWFDAITCSLLPTINGISAGHTVHAVVVQCAILHSAVQAIQCTPFWHNGLIYKEQRVLSQILAYEIFQWNSGWESD